MTLRRLRRLTTLLLLSAGLAPGSARAQQDSVILVRAGRLIDGTGAPARAGVSILVEEGYIKAVGPDVTAPAGATTIDGPCCPG
jgi:imidazolonepropionase-like amidohydrolase